MDLTSPNLVDELTPHTDGLEIGLLVYNAGAEPGIGLFLERQAEDALYLVDLNCRGPLLLAHHFGQAMAQRGRGGIVLTTTAGAVSGTGYVGAYTASKAFVQIFGEALWCELGQHHVDVLVAMVGPTDTPALRATGADLEPLRPVLMESRDVVAEVLAGLGSAGTSAADRARQPGRRAAGLAGATG